MNELEDTVATIVIAIAWITITALGCVKVLSLL